MASRFNDVWRIANLVIRDMEEWIKINDKKSVRLRYFQVDQVKLLKLRVWAYRHYIDIQEVLDLIVPPLRTLIREHKKSYGLGVSIRSLTSRRAYLILLSRLKERYPDDEHISIWRENERERQLQVEKELDTDGLVTRSPRVFASVLESPSAEAFIARYKKCVVTARLEQQRLYDQGWRKRRQYRGSPWI